MKKASLNHENHLITKQVYDHYSEKMVKVDGNKKKIKMFLQNERGKPVPMKLIHNIQTKNNKKLQGGSETVLQKLCNALTSVQGARVRFISNEDDEFIGKWKYL